MKNKKITIVLFLAIGLIFLNLGYVKALPSSLGPIKQVGNRVLDDCGAEECYGLALKVSSDTATMCTEYEKTSPAVGSATCTITNDWDEKVRYGVAAIINASKSNISADGITNEYFAAEMAINRFLSNKSSGGYGVVGSTLSTKYRSLYINYLDLANAAYDSYETDSKILITLSTTSLTFTLNGDNYESNSVTVSGVDNYNVTTDVGSVSKTGNSFKVIVPASSLNATKKVNVTVTSSKSLVQARNYSCGSNYQSITPVNLDTITKSDSRSLSGTIVPKSKLIINKVDNKNIHLSGATITVTGSKGYNQTFVTDGNPFVIENLEYDTYTIIEEKAPLGYNVAKVQNITLSENNLTGTVTIVNTLTKVKISKLDATGKKELPGATLEIQDENGNIIKYCKGENGNIGAECKWISTDKPYEIEGLPVGKYYLIETIAPKGYQLNTEKVMFEVKNDGSITEVVMENELEVEVPDTLSSKSALLLTIAMFDIALGIGIVTYVKRNKIKE